VFCQLVYLRRCIPARVRRALNELPETLDETYARALKEIDKPNWEYAHRLFQCVTAASRPFLVEELAEFLTFDFEAGATPMFLADWRPEDPTHTVLSTCSSLLTVVDGDVVNSEPVYMPTDPPDYLIPLPPHPGPLVRAASPRSRPPSHSRPSPRSPRLAAQFAHFSVKEYLTSARLAEGRDPISRFHVSMTSAHTIIAQACLGVLLHLDENITEGDLEDFPLAEYAAQHWVNHARFENVASNVLDGMKHLFDPSKIHLSVWVWIRDPGLPSWVLRAGRPKRPETAIATPLHYAACCDLHDIASFLIVEHSQDVNARGFNQKETPLHTAVRRGHVEVSRVLLEHGADTEARDKDDYSPLERAIQIGHVGVAQVLLGHGADVSARNEGWYTPLHCASAMGQPAVALVLLRHGADLEARCKNNRTPLHCAKGEEITRLLLGHGADANALGTYNQTPLHRVSELGRMGPARVLLEHGVDANARDANNATPLHLASDSMNRSRDGEYILIVLLLIQYGSDIRARDDKGQTPFIRAEEAGQLPQNRWPPARYHTGLTWKKGSR
jgi:ankyrin repeat protein